MTSSGATSSGWRRRSVARGAGGGVAGRASNVPVSLSRNFRQVGARSLLGASGFGASIFGASIFAVSFLDPFPIGVLFGGMRGSIVLGVLVPTRAGLAGAAGATLSRWGFAGASFTGPWGRRLLPGASVGTRRPLRTTLSSAGLLPPLDVAGETTLGAAAATLGGSTRRGRGGGST